MAFIKTVIDGKEIEVERDSWALDVASQMGIEIPTLCHHPALTPYGACRLCVVEVTKGKSTWLTTSCDLPIRDGLTIRTNTPEVINSRKITLELMWARAPEAEVIAELAAKLGIDKPRFKVRNELGRCILCGLCVRVCDQLIGVSALNFSRRGVQRKVSTPFEKASNTCIGCNACVAVCPTGHIRVVDKGTIRNFETWNTPIEMIECNTCHKPYMPAKEFEYIQTRLTKGSPIEKICPKCRRADTVTRLHVASVSKDKKYNGGISYGSEKTQQ